MTNKSYRAKAFGGRWLPILIGLMAVGVTLYLWRALVDQQEAHLRRTVQSEAAGMQNRIASYLDSETFSLVRMAKQWEYWGKDLKQVWTDDATSYAARNPAYQAIAWVNPQFQAKWVAPVVGNAWLLERDLASDARQHAALEEAKLNLEVTVTHAIDLPTQKKGLLVCVPIFKDDNFGGFIVGVFDARQLLEGVLRKPLASGYRVAVLDGDEQVFASGAPRAAGQAKTTAASDPGKAFAQEKTLDLRGVPWRLQVWPSEELLAKERSILPAVALALGFSMATLLSVAVHYAKSPTCAPAHWASKSRNGCATRSNLPS